MPHGPSLPSGIVTFVFTDVEGSTRLLRRLGDTYADVLDRHLDLLSSAWDEHGGHPVDTAGDGVFVAFADATGAVQACAAAQRRLNAEPWPEGADVRARIGVHTGLAAPRSGSYRSLAVHEAARVMAAAHGGQVLLTDATVGRLRALDSVAIAPLGRYRVRDFEEPVQLFQLSGSDLPSAFPAVRALPADRHNLVPAPTSFHGRDQEVADVSALLGPGRLVTLSGPGGVGKTRLATEIGCRAAATWHDGVWLVDLAPLDDPSLLAPALATALGVPGRGGDRWAEVVAHLRERQALLVLDNCERLARPCAAAVDELLAACRACGVLATSRAPLGSVRERLVRIPPLAVDGQGTGPAVALFLDRMAAVRDDLHPDEGALATVAAICRELDGLPLALELAAARLAVLSPDEVLDGLEHRFDLLRTRNLAVPERQRTLEALLEWSDRLLDDAERACLRRLGVFGGSFSVAGAVAAVGGDGVRPEVVPELVWSLVDTSLATADLTASPTRYRLLGSVRAFARDRLADRGEVESVAVRLARWYAETIGPECRHHRGWTSEAGVELDNVRALVPLVATSDPALAQQLAFTVGRHLEAVGSAQEGVVELRRHVDLLDAATPERISLLTTLADLHLRTGDIPAAQTVLREAEALHRRVGRLPRWDDVALERTRGELAHRVGDHAANAAAARRALAGDISLRGRARMWSQLGIASFALGDVDAGAHAFEEELAAFEALGDELYAASAHGNLAEAALRRQDPATAARHQRACLELGLELGTPVMVAFSLIVAARLAAMGGRWDTATTLHRHAESILAMTGVVLYDDDRRLSDEMLASARAALGPSAFSAAQAAGESLELPAAAALADRVLLDAATAIA